jgi:hypothetical protein
MKVHRARDDVRRACDEAKKKLAEAKKAHGKEPPDEAAKALKELEAKLKQLEKEARDADTRWSNARRKLQDAQKTAHGVLTRKRPVLAGSVKERIERALNAIKNDVNLYFEHAGAIRELCDASQDAGRKKAFLNARESLVKRGILKADDKGRFSLFSLLDGANPVVSRLTRYERNRIEWFNIAIMQNLIYPGLLNRRYERNYVNPVLATPKGWRDVYHYDAKGRLIGWTRHGAKGKQEFTADGALITKKDRLGRAIEARTVNYVIKGDKARPSGLKQEPGDTIRCYEYASDDDRVGRVAKEEEATP